MTKKRVHKSHSEHSIHHPAEHHDNINKLLIENFIALQKTMADLSVKFNHLSNNMSKLLELFEASAKSFAEKQTMGITKEDKDFLEKLDRLLEQNKLIAKGLTLMEERIRDKSPGPRPEIPSARYPELPAPETFNKNYGKPKQLPRF